MIQRIKTDKGEFILFKIDDKFKDKFLNKFINDFTDEEWASIVDDRDGLFFDYKVRSYFYKSPTESAKSLLKQYNIYMAGDNPYNRVREMLNDSNSHLSDRREYYINKYEQLEKNTGYFILIKIKHENNSRNN